MAFHIEPFFRNFGSCGPHAAKLELQIVPGCGANKNRAVIRPEYKPPMEVIRVPPVAPRLAQSKDRKPGADNYDKAKMNHCTWEYAT